MTPGFSVKFVINRITANYKIQITDITDYSGVSAAYGFYRIEYPDGLYQENTNVLNPDFEIGSSFSEFNLKMKNFDPMIGQYRFIQKIFADEEEAIETTKTITFSFLEPVLKLQNISNLAVPNVVFSDSTNYNLAFYSEQIIRLINCSFPESFQFNPKTSSSETIDMVEAGNYYEGVYSASLTSSCVYTALNHVIEWSKSSSFSFDIRKLLKYDDILFYLDVAKDRYDQSKGTTNESKERESYELVASIIEHIQLRAVAIAPGIDKLMFEIQDLIYKITCSYIDVYEYSSAPILPIDPEFFNEGVTFDRVLTINGVSYDLSQDRVWNVGTVLSVNMSVPEWMTVTGGPITKSGSFKLGLADGYYIPTFSDVSIWNQDIYIVSVSVSGQSTKTISLLRNDGVVLSAQWSDIDTFPVTSVNSKVGDVVLATGDIEEDASPVNLWFTQARARSSISLTVIGDSGPSTYNEATGVFNIPNYTLVGLGGVPLIRDITINGQTFDLSEDRVFTIDIGVSSATGESPITVTPSTGAIVVSHDDSLVSPGTYNKVTVDQKGHITEGANTTTDYSGTTPISLNVVNDVDGNTNVTVSHDNSGVTPGSYNKVTVDEKGHITIGENINDQDNFVRVLRIPRDMIDFNNDIKEEIANYINQMNPPLVIDDTDSKWNVVIDYSIAEILDSTTEINIWFDNSGSMNDVLEPLVNALTSCLKSLVLPIYGTTALYEERVKVYSFTPGSFTVNGQSISIPSKSIDSSAYERTFQVLNTMGSSDNITRVINLVFQDEAQSVYHQVPYNGSITQNYIDDLAAFKAELSLKKDINYYKGVIYQIANPFYQGAFGDLLQEAIAGTGNFSGVNSLTDLVSSEKLYVEYNIPQSNDSFFYLNLIRNTLLSLGFTNIGSTESLTCFIPITGLISVACNDFSGANGFIDVGGISGGSGSGYYFTLNGGVTQYTPGVGATGLVDGLYTVRIFDNEGNNYVLKTINISCFSALSGQATSACGGSTNGSGFIDVINVTGGSGSGYYFTLNGGVTQYTPGVGAIGLNDGSYLVTLYDGAETNISLGTLNIACVQTYNINRYLCGTCTQIGTGAVEYNPAFPLIIGKFYRLTNGETAEVTGISNFVITHTISDSLNYYNSCAEVPCA